MKAAAEHHEAVRGRLRHGERLARHTAWGIGGPADRFFEPADAEGLARFLATVDADEPVFWLGLGSNLLVRDGGIAGVVIDTRRLGDIAVGDDAVVRVACGAACPKVARVTARAGLAGAEFMAGIPGTVGGALAMNAGAFGGETWPLVARVETVDRMGVRRWRGPECYRYGYRSVEGPDGEWFLAADLALGADVDAAARERIRSLLERRAATQPLGTRNCGSVFRNPPGDHAARLIEASGLKGTRIGGAEVSRKHANFIINVADARSGDVEALIELVRETVERDSGVRLQPEVRVVGRPAGDAR